MAKIKDSSVLNVDLESEVTEYNANKKTALNITNYTGWHFTTDDAKTLKITNNIKTVTITNASKLKYIKTTTETDYSDLIAMGLIDYTGTITGKNNKYTGTIYNDTITGSDFKDTINGNSGNDTIDGGGNDDKITGGAGTNTILLYTAKKFGNDTVTLTKGENLHLKLADSTDLGKITTEIKGKDLVITVNKGQPSYESSVTIKNYTKKDVITSEGELQIIGANGTVLYDFREEFFNTTYMDADHYTKSSFTGTWINDEVNAENFVTTVKKGKTEETTKGVTINLGGASFENGAIGSKYADTIKGGANNDGIRGGNGNDTITGGAGENTLVYYKGDGADTVNLTKNEMLNIRFEDLSLGELHIDYANKNKDVKIWYEGENNEEAGSITLKNFASKDVAKSVVIVDKTDATFNFKNDYIKTIVNQSNFTGTLLNDFIDASKSGELTKKNKHVNMVLNGGKGNDKIVGSQFADTIKGGDGGDIIEGGKGNDLLYGEKGDNVFVFNSGDGKDTIYSGNGADTLRFMGDDNTQPLLAFDMASNEKDLIIYYGMDRTSTITVKDFYKKSAISETNPKGINPKCTVKYVQFGKTGNPINIEKAIDDAETEYKDIVATGSGTNFDIKSSTQYIIGSDNDDEPDLTATSKSPLYISLGDGNDTVTDKHSQRYEITGGNGNKTITTSNLSDKITVGNGLHNINAGAGVNEITAGDNTSTETAGRIITGAGHDTIKVGNGNYSINAGGGANNIETGDGDHTITTGIISPATLANTEYIKTGDGNNTITTGDGQGYRNIETGDGNQKITTGESDDVIKVGNGLHDIDADRGNNNITAGDNTSTEELSKITTDYGNDTIIAGDGGYEINSGDGNDTITTGSGDDNITTGFGHDTIDAGDGHNIITTGNGQKEITVGDSTSTVTDPEDENYNIGSEITLSGGNDDSEIIAGSGNDKITFQTASNNVTIDSGAGDDTITFSQGDDTTIRAGEGNNKIYFASGGNSYRFNITSGSGDDKIELTHALGVSTIDAGAGDNEITINNNSSGLELTLTTLDGDDTITSNSSGLETIDAGDGRNTISTGNGKKLITVGDSTVTDTQDENYNIGSQITLGGANDESEITAGSGDDEVIIKNNGGSTLTLDLGAGDNEVSIDSNGLQSSDIKALGGDDTFTSEGQLGSYSGSDKNEIDLGDGTNTVTLKDAYRTTVTTGAGDDTITFNGHGRNNEIKAGEGKNTIKYGTDMEGWNSEDGVTITTGAGDDEITIGGFSEQGEGIGSVGGNHINAGNGDNTIKIAYTINSEITTGSGDDTIEIAKNSSDNSTSNIINAGAGANTITLGKGSNNTITTEGDAVQTITLGQVGKTNSANTVTTGGGADKITIIGTNNTIDAGEGENEITVTESNEITTGDDKDTINASGSFNVINAGNGNNEITAKGDGNKIYTGTGDDTITAGEHGGYNEIYIGTYDEDEEEVTVEGGTNNTVNLGDHSSNKVYIYNTKIEEGKVNTINIGDNASSNVIEVMNGHTEITGDGAHYSSVTTGDGDDVISLTGDNNTINAGGGTNNITTGVYKSNVTTGDGNDTITISTDGSNANINAGGGTNTISSEYQFTSSEITTGDGDDTVSLGKAGEKYVQNNTIALGEGKNTLTIERNYGSNTITTGAGDDEFYISGSGGDDNINAGNGNNIIHYGLGLDSSWSAQTNTITTGSGNDEIIVGTFDEEGNELGSVTDMVINAGGGSNTVKIAGQTDSNSVITTGDEVQNITIGKSSYDNEVTTEGGNDIIKLGEKDFSYNNTINAGEGDNVIVIGNQDMDVDESNTYNNTVITGDGDDTITIGNHNRSLSNKNIIKAGDGHNIISVGRGAVSITAGDSTNEETNMGSEITVNGDLSYSSNGSDITTGSGDDIITITGNMASTTINAGTGDNKITIINPTEDTEDETRLSLASMKITTLDGDDEITVGYNNGNVTINAGGGDNTISINGSYETVNTGSGKDTVTVGSSKLTTGYSTVNIGAYDEEQETVTTEGGAENTVTIIGGDTNTVNIYNTQTVEDKFNTVNIEGGSGSNTINVLGGHTLIDLGGTVYNRVTTGDGDDIITNAGYGAKINAGNGDNRITVTSEGGSTYVTTGDGDDIIDLMGGTEIRSGGGDDTININGTNFNPDIYMGAGTDTLNINKDFSAQMYVHFNKGDGHDTITGIHEGMVGLPITVDPSVDFYVKPNDEKKSSMDIVLIEDGVETGDVLTVENVYNEDGTAFNQFILDQYAYKINGTKFEDCYTEASIIEGEGEINGTAGDDIIIGSDNDDTIYPKEGIDVISPKGGDDIIDLESMSYTKTVHYNKGDGNLTLQNIGGTHVELYMEDATAEDTIIEKHGTDMYIIRSNNETLTIKNAYNGNGGIIATVTIYEKDGTSYGPIWVYPNNAEKAVNVYDDEGVIVPDAYAYAQNFRVTAETTTIKTDELYKVDHGTNYVIYGTNSVNPVTVDLSWCYSSGYVNWNKEDNGDLTMRVMVDTESGDVNTNVVEIKILEFFNEYNSVNTFKFDAYTRDYNEIEPLWNTIDKSEEETSQLIQGTWRRDVITGSSVGHDTIYANGGDDEITAISAQTIEGGDGKDKITLTGSADGAYVYGDTLGWRNIEQGANDKIYGGSGNDNLFGCGGDDEIHGGAGEDYIEGGYGDDNLYGGTGNDTLHGIEGNNTYHFFTGDGTDEVNTAHGGETIKFEDIDFNDITYARDTYNNLELSYGSGDKVKIISHDNYDDDNVTVVDQNKDTKTIFFSVYRNDGDMMYGTDGDDIFLGTSWGSTKITAGEGNDIINITENNQSYHNYYFNTGDGHDTIIDHSEKTSSSYLHMNDSDLEDTNFVKSGNDLIIKYNYDEGKGDYADSVTLNEFFGGGNSANRIYYQGDEIARNIISENGNIHKETVTENFTGSTLNDYITIGANDITVAGGDGYNTYVVNNGTSATITSTSENDKIVMNGWGLGAYTLTGDGADVILENEDKTVSLRFTNGAAFGNKNIGFYGPSGTLLNNLSNMLTANNFYAFNTGGAHDGTNNNDYIWASGNASGLNCNGGSDTIYSDAYIEIATYTDRDAKDTTEGVKNKVYLSGDLRHTVHASGETNIISSSGNSRDIYQAYIDQTTSITDAGGDDSFTLKNTGSSDDGYYKISGELNTHLFFKVDADFDITKDTFDVNIGKGSDMDNAAQGNDHVGIFIKDNQVENISTSDGYSITSAQLETIAEQAAGWIADKGYTTYDDMLKSPGGEDLAKDYVSFINTKAQDYWQAPTP